MDQESRPRPDPSEGSAPSATAAALVLPLMAVALTFYYLYDTTDVTWEARATGVLVGAVLLTLVAIQFVTTAAAALRGRFTWGWRDLFDGTTMDQRRMGLLLVSAVFIMSIEWIGTTLGLIVVIATSLLITGVRSVKQIVLISVITAGTVYGLLIFLLGSRLPRGPIEHVIDRLLGT